MWSQSCPPLNSLCKHSRDRFILTRIHGIYIVEITYAIMMHHLWWGQPKYHFLVFIDADKVAILNKLKRRVLRPNFKRKEGFMGSWYVRYMEANQWQCFKFGIEYLILVIHCLTYPWYPGCCNLDLFGSLFFTSNVFGSNFSCSYFGDLNFNFRISAAWMLFYLKFRT